MCAPRSFKTRQAASVLAVATHALPRPVAPAPTRPAEARRLCRDHRRAGRGGWCAAAGRRARLTGAAGRCATACSRRRRRSASTAFSVSRARSRQRIGITVVSVWLSSALFPAPSFPASRACPAPGLGEAAAGQAAAAGRSAAALIGLRGLARACAVRCWRLMSVGHASTGIRPPIRSSSSGSNWRPIGAEPRPRARRAAGHRRARR